MKNIEALVTDLETSRKLQEAGIKYETAFVRCKKPSRDYLLILRKEIIEIFGSNASEIIPAFTTGELMQVLPCEIEYKKLFYRLVFLKEPNNEANYGYIYRACYTAYFMGQIKDVISENENKHPHQALSKLCLWCKKEGYL